MGMSDWGYLDYTIYGGALVFGVTALTAFIMLVRDRCQRFKYSMVGDRSFTGAGTTLRHLIHVLLLVGTAGRCVMLLYERQFDSMTGLNLWWACLVHTAPDLFFMSVYSLIILFCAQLVYVARDVPFGGIKLAFLGINFLIYAAYGVLGAYALYAKQYMLFWHGTEWGSAVVYCISILAVLYYGNGVAGMLRLDPGEGGSVDYRDVQRQRFVFRRVTGLVGSCVLIFAIKATLGFLTVLNLVNNEEGVPLDKDNHFLVNRSVYGLIVFAVVELLPSWVILAITRRREQRRSGSKESRESSTGTHSSHQPYDTAWPQHMEDEFALTNTYPPPSPLFPGYGTATVDPGYSHEGSNGAFTTSTALGGSVSDSYLGSERGSYVSRNGLTYLGGSMQEGSDMSLYPGGATTD